MDFSSTAISKLSEPFQLAATQTPRPFKWICVAGQRQRPLKTAAFACISIGCTGLIWKHQCGLFIETDPVN